jgi:hypothetical protein
MAKECRGRVSRRQGARFLQGHLSKSKRETYQATKGGTHRKQTHSCET